MGTHRSHHSGAIAFFGTYTVNEADRSYTVRVYGSWYPNWNGTDVKQVVESITADELKIEILRLQSADHRRC